MNGLARITSFALRSVSDHPRLCRIHPSYFSRGLGHTPRPLPYPIEDGIGDFLPPAALETLAVDYQQGLLDRLSELVKDTEQQNKTVAQTVIDTASDRTKTLAFNYASQALNNSFFLDFLKPPPPTAFNNELEISPSLHTSINEDFGSLDQLKSIVSAAAMGLSSSGWIWLACDRTGLTGVIPTFGAGTLLVGSSRIQSPVSSTVLGESIGSPDSAPTASTKWPQPPASPVSGLTPPPHSNPQNPTSPPLRSIHTTSSVASFGSIHAAKAVGLHGTGMDGTSLDLRENVANFANIGTELFPLFCISVHEHAWLTAGYGIWGKEEYLKRFWTVLDWGKVSDAFAKFATEMHRY